MVMTVKDLTHNCPHRSDNKKYLLLVACIMQYLKVLKKETSTEEVKSNKKT